MSDMTMNDASQPARDAGFDNAIRAHHDAAVERISPRVRAQLAQRRNAVLRGQPAARVRHGFRYAAGLAALGALAFGLQFGNLSTPPVAATTPSAVAAASTGSNGNTTMLDEDPDFYAWLASSDAQLVAME